MRNPCAPDHMPARARSGLRRGPLAFVAVAGLMLAGALSAEQAVDPYGVDVGQRLAAPAQIVELVDGGDFAGAESAIAAALGDASLTSGQRAALEFQRERMRRILLDFSLDEAGAKERLRRHIPDLTDAEFARWDEAGLIEARVIDGERRWFNRGPSNLFRLSGEARERRATPLNFYDSPLELEVLPHHVQVREAALESGERAVAPHRVRVTQSLTVKPDEVPAGETVRAISKVRQVHNELLVQSNATLFSRTNDNWIATKLRSKILVNHDIESDRVKSVVENRVVYLMGLLTREEANLVSSIAAGISGVEKVVRVIEYIER